MLVIEIQPIPLHIDANGVARVGGTRVTLDTVVSSFLDGDSAEEIIEQYPALVLADVYTILAYYLNHRAEIDQYLVEQRQGTLETRQVVTARVNQTGIRQRLLARKGNQE